jgi:hypothetical protein
MKRYFLIIAITLAAGLLVIYKYVPWVPAAEAFGFGTGSVYSYGSGRVTLALSNAEDRLYAGYYEDGSLSRSRFREGRRK